jgi:hypothetical protein
MAVSCAAEFFINRSERCHGEKFFGCRFLFLFSKILLRHVSLILILVLSLLRLFAAKQSAEREQVDVFKPKSLQKFDLIW